MKNQIGFICDRKKHCQILKGCGKECKRTTDPEHAINFSKLDDDCYIEREEREIPDPKWVSVYEQVPENEHTEYLITVLDKEDGISEVYKGFYQDGEWWTQWCHGCQKISEEPCGENVVTAWMELPKPYTGKWIDFVNSHCTCPICGSEWSYFDNETERFNYCPNCGADIQEG